jgi:hypothetical protein
LLVSCAKKGITDKKEYMKWISDPAHGLIQKRNINGVNIIVRYLPPEFLVFNELKNSGKVSEKTKDSLINYYSKRKIRIAVEILCLEIFPNMMITKPGL